MKRCLCTVLAALLLCLCGCHYNERGDVLEPVEFFYPRVSDGFLYGASDGVLAGEIREASGRSDDMNYLLTMYLRGPQSAGLRSPFPDGCNLQRVSWEGSILWVTLSPEFAELENMELTLACASLAKTCFSISSATAVRLMAESETQTVSMTVSPDDLWLADHSVFKTQPATEESE